MIQSGEITPRTRSAASWLWIVPLLWITTWLGARGLDADAIWLDETWSLYTAGGAHYGPISPAAIIDRVAHEEVRSAGPGYVLALAGWGQAVGWTAFAARALSLLCGLLAVAWTYRLGQAVISPLAGLAAAAVLGTSAFFIYFTHELRAYMMATAFVPAALWCYWRLLHAPRLSWSLCVGWVVALLGLLYVHYLAAVGIAAVGVYHLLAVRKDRRWWQITGLMLLAGLLFVPWLGPLHDGMALAEDSTTGGGHVVLPPEKTLDRLAHYFGGGSDALLALVLVLALAGLAVWGARGRAARIVWVWGLVALGAVLAANARFEIFGPGRERYLLLLWPLLALLAGLGVTCCQRRWNRAGRLITWALLAVWLVNGIQTSRDPAFTSHLDGAQALPWDDLAAAVRREAAPDDAVVVSVTVPDWVMEITTAEYHLHGLPVRFALAQSLPSGDLTKIVADFVDGAGQVWLGLDKRMPPDAGYESFIAALPYHYRLCRTVFDQPRLRLDLYRRLPAMAFDIPMARGRFGDGIALTYNDVTPVSPVPSGETIHVVVAWAVDEAVPVERYSVALHLIDMAGNLAAQADYGLPGRGVNCREVSISLRDLPPGVYHLWAVVYAWETGERLPSEDRVTGERSDRLWLEKIEITG